VLGIVKVLQSDLVLGNSHSDRTEVVLSRGKIWGRPYNSWLLLPSIFLPIHCSHSIPNTWPMQLKKWCRNPGHQVTMLA